MDYREQRPPRASRPGQQQQNQPPLSPPTIQYPDRSSSPGRPQIPHHHTNVSFQVDERASVHPSADQQRQRAYYSNDPEALDPSRVGRKKSLVRPDREKIDPGHRQWHYRNHAAAQLESDSNSRFGVLPSGSYTLPFIHFAFLCRAEWRGSYWKLPFAEGRVEEREVTSRTRGRCTRVGPCFVQA